MTGYIGIFSEINVLHVGINMPVRYASSMDNNEKRRFKLDPPHKSDGSPFVQDRTYEVLRSSRFSS